MKRRLVEKIKDKDGVSVKDLTDRIERILYLEGTPCLVMGFFCSNEEIYNVFIDYLGKRLKAKEDWVIRYDIEQGRIDLIGYFEKNLEFLKLLGGDKILIAADKFERLPHFENNNFYNINRSGWDYNQSLSEWIVHSGELTLIKKQIIIPTHVGYSLGQEIYERALTGAHAGSRHRSFMFEART